MGGHVTVCLLYSSHFISHHVELIETVIHPDLGMEGSSNKDSVSQLRNRRKVLFDNVLVWASVRWNIKRRIRSVLGFIMRLTSQNGCCASHRGPSDISVAQLNFFSPLNTADLEGRSAGWPSSRHTLVWELGGMCLPLGEVLMEPLQLFVSLRLLQQVTWIFTGP